MSVVKADVKADGRNIRESFTGSYIRVVTWDSQGKPIVNWYPLTEISGTVVYAAFSDSPRDSSMTIMQSSLLPALGASYCDESGVHWSGVYFNHRTSRFIGPSGNYFLWEVTYTVDGSIQKQVEEEQNSIVLMQFDVSSETYEDKYIADLDGKFNVNSLGAEFDEPLVYKRPLLNFTYKRREYENPVGKIANYLGAMNSVDLWGYPAHTIRLFDMNFSSTTTVKDVIYDVTYRFQYRSDTWDVVKPNSSYYYRQSGAFRRVLNSDMSPSEKPVLIELDGTPVPLGIAPPMQRFRVYPERDLNELDLPSPFEL